MFDESIKFLLTSNNRFNTIKKYTDNAKLQVKFEKQEKITFTHIQVVNIYTFNEILLWSYTKGADFGLGNFLFAAVNLIKNVDPDKYSYTGYGIEFDAPGNFLLSDGSDFGKNTIIFNADVSSSVHIDNSKKDILILGTRIFYNFH